MAGDNYTPRKVRAITDCPGGQRPGQVFEVTQDVADILITVGAVEFADEPAPETKPKGSYKRRDLRADP